MPFKKQCQAIPTLTWRDDHTTIGCGKLNCRVRDGAGCFLSACVHLTIPGGLSMSPPITMKLKTLTSIECECLRCNHSLWSFCFTHSVIQKHPQGVMLNLIKRFICGSTRRCSPTENVLNRYGETCFCFSQAQRLLNRHGEISFIISPRLNAMR